MADDILETIPLVDVGPVAPQPAPSDDLFKAIKVEVVKDGFRKGALLPGESEARAIQMAAEVIYFDVSEFYYWYFSQDSDELRNQFLANQKKSVIPSALRAVVKPVVVDNLADMREADLIPAGLDSEGLADIIIDNLSRYIVNWQDWYYDRKLADEQEDFEWSKTLYDEIYVDSDYGDLSNLSNYDDDDVDNPFEEIS